MDSIEPSKVRGGERNNRLVLRASKIKRKRRMSLPLTRLAFLLTKKTPLTILTVLEKPISPAS